MLSLKTLACSKILICVLYVRIINSLNTRYFLLLFSHAHLVWHGIQVADTVVAVVDHQSQLVIGLTAAMAWELPFDPFYPEEELQEAYEEGRLPLLQIDFEQEDDDEDDDDDDDEDKKNKKQHRRKDNSTSIKYHSKKKSSKKPTQLPLPSELNPRPPSQYFNQPSPYVNYLQPMHSTNYYAGRPQQPHPYYTNYGSDKSPAFDGYYSSNNRIPTQSFLGYQPNSNKLNYYLSYADKLFREYKAQLNRSGSTSDAPNDRTPIAEKKNDDKYGLLGLSNSRHARFIHKSFQTDSHNSI